MSSFSLALTRPSGVRVPVLTVNGELDLYTARDFEKQLLELAESETGGLVVDLCDCKFVDSSACRALLHAAKVLRRHGGRLVVLYGDQEVERILHVMGLDEFLDLVDRCPEPAPVSTPA